MLRSLRFKVRVGDVALKGDALGWIFGEIRQQTLKFRIAFDFFIKNLLGFPVAFHTVKRSLKFCQNRSFTGTNIALYGDDFEVLCLHDVSCVSCVLLTRFIVSKPAKNTTKK